MDERGVVIIAYGERAKRAGGRCAESLGDHNNLPVHIISEANFDDGNNLGRWAKVNLDLLSPFDCFAYLDADTLPQCNLTPGLEMLDDGWEMVIVPSGDQGDQAMWHIGKWEREATVSEAGCLPLQLQAGVMFVRKCPAIHHLFKAWRDEWQRWRGQDQAALLRALYRSPVRVYLLGRPWNGGELIEHHFGEAR